MGYRVSYLNHAVEPNGKETVLEALLRVGAHMPFSCKGGSCLTCLSQCTEGAVPKEAQKGLSAHLREANYLLPCKCVAESDMVLRPPQPEDMITGCLLCESSTDDAGRVHLKFETMRAIDYRAGQTLRLVMPGADGQPEPVLRLIGEPADDMMVDAVIEPQIGVQLPAWMVPEAVFGQEFEVRGPFEFAADSSERPAPKIDPALWTELDNGRVVREVLESFYPKVYADELLKPFFARSTMERAIDKQYSFLKRCMTGEPVYFGDRPRNSHHWMIITPALFDYRQQLMVETLREHGLSESQIARWTYFEEHYRADLVKDKPFPKRVGDQDVDTEGFDVETLSEATVCDHCGAEVESGVPVLYHRRLGTISCPVCAPGVAEAAGESGTTAATSA